MHFLSLKNKVIIHRFGDREVEMTSLLTGLIVKEVLNRLIGHSLGPLDEPLDQIILNEYTKLKLKEGSS